MRITQVNISNFLGLEALDLHLQVPVNLIVGHNEAGKSSIRDAILWCLTGQARGLKTHQEQAAMIRNGGKAAEVTVTLDDGRTVTRRKTPKSPASISGGWELSPVILDGLLCDPFIFLSWPEAARRELLFRLIPGLTPTTEDIANRLLNHLHPGEEKAAGLDPGEFEAINRLAALAAKQGFPQAEKEAVAMRRETKRLRESLAQVREPDPKIDIGERTYILPDVDRDAVTAALRDLQKQRDALIKVKGRREVETNRAAAIEKELAALKAQIPEPPREGLREEWLEEVEGLAKERDRIQESLEAMGIEEIFPDLCPAIRSTEIPCPKAGEKIGAPADPARVRELQGLLEGIGKAFGEAMKSLAEVEEKEKANKAATDKIARLEKDLAGLKKNGPSDDTDKQVAALDRRLDNGRALLAAVEKFWTEKERADQAEAQLEATEKEIALYDALAKALAPEGIPSQMIAEVLGPVNDLLAIASAILFPGRNLALNGDLDIELSGSPFSTLSKSARFRVGVAFQYVLAKLAGEKLLLIDEADILDPLNRAALTDFLLNIMEDFDTIMVFATSNQAHPSPYPDIQVWWLEDGRIAPVVQMAA